MKRKKKHTYFAEKDNKKAYEFGAQYQKKKKTTEINLMRWNMKITYKKTTPKTNS